MAQRLARIPIITEPVNDIGMVVESINYRIDEINRVLQELELDQAKQKGDDSNVPKLNNNLDLQNFKLLNVARSRNPQDVVTRRELEEIGILGSRSNSIELTGDLTVNGTVTVNGPQGAGGDFTVITQAQVEALISAALGTEVATTRDGSFWSREAASGVDGDSGTVAMGVDGQGKARPLELRDGELPIQDMEVRTLLALILEQLEKLNNAN